MKLTVLLRDDECSVSWKTLVEHTHTQKETKKKKS